MDGHARFEVFRDSRGEYRWHLRSGDDRILATSGEGHRSEQRCREAIAAVQEVAATATLTATSG